MEVIKNIRNFDDWMDYLKEWQSDIGVKIEDAQNFVMTPMYDAEIHPEIEFGDFKGQTKWDRITQVPTQNMRDSLLALTFVQGDTEFASVEQQRRLLENVPHDYDRYAAVRIMLEEIRHGLQMCHILVEHFGTSGKVEARKLLVHFIREDLNLTGTHIGCDTTHCGACTVLLNGQAVKSCTVFAVQADGKTVQTIEGMAQNGTLHPLQEGFWEKHGLQCGYCTPGMIMSASHLLAKNANPSEEEIREAIAGNLCRCTGYNKIVEAIQYAAEKMQAEPEEVAA